MHLLLHFVLVTWIRMPKERYEVSWLLLTQLKLRIIWGRRLTANLVIFSKLLMEGAQSIGNTLRSINTQCNMIISPNLSQ